MSVPVELWIELRNTNRDGVGQPVGRTLSLHIPRVYPALPREGDLVCLSEVGWNETVRRVVFTWTEKIQIEFRTVEYDAANEDLFGMLLNSGWLR